MNHPSLSIYPDLRGSWLKRPKIASVGNLAGNVL